MYILLTGSLEGVTLLLQNGANVTLATIEGRTPTHIGMLIMYDRLLADPIPTVLNINDFKYLASTKYLEVLEATVRFGSKCILWERQLLRNEFK